MIRTLPSRRFPSFFVRHLLLAALLAGMAVSALAQNQSQSSTSGQGQSQPQARPQTPAQPETSLAEQAAALHGAPAIGSLDPKVVGEVVDHEYRNDYFGFAMKAIPGWETLNRGQMNVNEAMVRDLFGLKAGVNAAASGRVFGMHGPIGSSVFVGIQVPKPDTTPGNFGTELEHEIKAEIPQVRLLREPIVLGDSGRRFNALRIGYNFEGVPISQTIEYIFLKEHVVIVVATALGPEQLTAILHDLQPRFRWTETAGN